MLSFLSPLFSVSSTSDPVSPDSFDVQLDPVQAHSSSSGLQVFWSRSAGHVDWYDVTLEDPSTGSTHRTRVMDSAAPQSGFSSLVPGTLYIISVVATAGDKSAPPVYTSATTGETHRHLSTPQLLQVRHTSNSLLFNCLSPPINCILASLVQLRHLSKASR